MHTIRGDTVENNIALNAFIGILQVIEEKSGIVINEQNAHLLESRLAVIMQNTMTSSLEELYFKVCVQQNQEATTQIIEAITTNETSWFRDKALWTMMEEIFLPHYVQKLRDKTCSKIRIWSAACSYGQEPYSLAMCIDSYLKHHAIEDININHFEILATDISHGVINAARNGKYDTISITRGLEDHYKHRYFKHEGKHWRLNEDIRSAIRFQQFNLILDAYHFEPFDIIFCRNVLIYFSQRTKREVYKKMAQSLKNDGTLFIGSSELLEDNNELFTREQHMNSVYFKKKTIEAGERFE